MYDDMTLICRACGESFTFSAGEQTFYANKGFDNSPSRCPECRKNGTHGSSRFGDKDDGGDWKPRSEQFAATCARCGKATQASARQALGDGIVHCSRCTTALREESPVSAGGWYSNW